MCLHLVYPFKSNSVSTVLLLGVCMVLRGSFGALACVLVELYIAGTPMRLCSLQGLHTSKKQN